MNFHEIHSFLPLPRWLNEAYLQNMMTAPSQEKVMEFKETFTLLSQARCPCRPCRSCRAGFVLTCLLHPLPVPTGSHFLLAFHLPFQTRPCSSSQWRVHDAIITTEMAKDGESMEEYGTMHWHVPHHRRMFVVCLLVCWCLLYCWRADQVLFRYRYVEPIRHRADVAACGLCDARDRERRRAEQQQANAKVPMPMTRWDGEDGEDGDTDMDPELVVSWC